MASELTELAEEAAVEIAVCDEEPHELLDEAPRPQKKAISDTHVWW